MSYVTWYEFSRVSSSYCNRWIVWGRTSRQTVFPPYGASCALWYSWTAQTSCRRIYSTACSPRLWRRFAWRLQRRILPSNSHQTLCLLSRSLTLSVTWKIKSQICIRHCAFSLDLSLCHLKNKIANFRNTNTNLDLIDIFRY